MKRKKQELLAFGDLEASEKIMELANEDMPGFDFWEKREIYQHNLHLLTKVQDDLLAVFIFKTEELLKGVRKPCYILFLDRSENDFITYDTAHKKWRKAMLEHLSDLWQVEDEIFVTAEEEQTIQAFFCSEQRGCGAIFDFQSEVRKKQFRLRCKKETEPWDLEMKVAPPYPKDFHRWLEKSATKEHFIFYHYKKEVQEGYCSWCERTVPISRPKHNKVGTCPRCRHRIQYKAAGRGKRIYTEATAYLLQKCGTKVLIRTFAVRMCYRLQDYKNPILSFGEVGRIFLDERMREHGYYYGRYRDGMYRWIRSNEDGEICHRHFPDKGAVYRRTLPSVNRTFFKKTGFYEMVRHKNWTDPVNYLAYWIEHPYIEKLAKAGLFVLAEELLAGMKEIEVEERGELAKCLKLDRRLLKRLRCNQGGIAYLRWLQMEKRQGKVLPDEVIAWLEGERIRAESLAFIEDKMSGTQIRNYLLRQTETMQKSIAYVLVIWRDYLAMAERLGMDVTDEIVYRTPKLKERHDEAVRLLEKEDIKKSAAKFGSQYPKVAEICQSIRGIYEYLEDDAYAVLVPKGIDEIALEGRILHHCVGQGVYYQKISTHESYILFLRKKKELETPYYTMEVKPDGTILQYQTEYNRRKNEERQELQEFLTKWQESVSEKTAAWRLKMA